jgi:hypothetical protein
LLAARGGAQGPTSVWSALAARELGPKVLVSDCIPDSPNPGLEDFRLSPLVLLMLSVLSFPFALPLHTRDLGRYD